MARLSFAAIALLVSATASADPGALDAELRWQLDFGGGETRASYGLSLGLRDGALDALPRLVAVDVSDTTALARFAGVPLAARDFRLAQNDLPADDAVASPRPWYARSWVLWTVGGIAATVAAVGSGGTTIEVNGNDDGGTDSAEPRCVGGVSGNLGEEEIPCQQQEDTGCAGNVCATCEDGDILSTCDSLLGRAIAFADERSVERQRWLDAGTGHMGDLRER